MIMFTQNNSIIKYCQKCSLLLPYRIFEEMISYIVIFLVRNISSYWLPISSCLFLEINYIRGRKWYA